MSFWTHYVCDTCYQKEYPGREPVRLKDDRPTYGCCSCGWDHSSGIFMRKNPEMTLCHGMNRYHIENDKKGVSE